MIRISKCGGMIKSVVVCEIYILKERFASGVNLALLFLFCYYFFGYTLQSVVVRYFPCLCFPGFP